MPENPDVLSAVARVFSKIKTVSVQKRVAMPLRFPEDLGKESLSSPICYGSDNNALIRGEIDSGAMVRRFHDPIIHRRLLAQEAKNITEELGFCEWARVLILGGQRWKGLRDNIVRLLIHGDEEMTQEKQQETERSEKCWSLFYALYDALAGEVSSHRGKVLFPHSLVKRLEPLVYHQEKFCHALLPFLHGIAKKTSKKQQHTSPPQQQQKTLSPSSKEESSPKDLVSPNVSPKRQKTHKAMFSPKGTAHKNLNKNPIHKRSASLPYRPPVQARLSPYRVYTRAGDQVITASHLLSEQKLRTLFHHLDKKHILVRSLFERQMTHLRHMLLARKRHAWMGAHVYGRIDTQRLVRIVTTPSSGLFYRHMEEDILKDTFVTLLVDNSGSMKGLPIEIACLCVDFFCKTLEACGVRSEILGFTTQHWKGGSAAEAWKKAGEPPFPGRLNNLLHIIYKDGYTSWKKSRHRMGLMLQEGFLKENIDGEALLWAYHRLCSRHESRRILLVISDGAPVDDATIAANDASILAKHLSHTTAMIEHSRNVELAAVGIKHDVTHYYRCAINIHALEDLSYALVYQLLRMLAYGPKQ